MKKSKLDLKFEKMSRECAESMTGTHPPKSKTKISTKKKVKRG